MITAPTSATATETAERGRRGMIKPAQLRPLFQCPHHYQAIAFTPRHAAGPNMYFSGLFSITQVPFNTPDT